MITLYLLINHDVFIVHELVQQLLVVIPDLLFPLLLLPLFPLFILSLPQLGLFPLLTIHEGLVLFFSLGHLNLLPLPRRLHLPNHLIFFLLISKQLAENTPLTFRIRGC